MMDCESAFPKLSNILPLDEPGASRAVTVLVSGSIGRTDRRANGRTNGNALGVSEITRRVRDRSHMVNLMGIYIGWAME